MRYTTKLETTAEKCVVVDDMILTCDLPTAAGSKMLAGYTSLFEAEVLTRLTASGFALGGKSDVGEFAFDLLGESSANGANVADGKLMNAGAQIVAEGEAMAAVGVDVNGAVRRGAAQAGLVCVKPTYGTVSRFGIVPVACSGETVSVTARKVVDAKAVLSAIVGHDAKDGTSLSDAQCAQVLEGKGAVRRVAVLTALTDGLSENEMAKLSRFRDALSAKGIEVAEVADPIFKAARVAWNILMTAELCNNVSRYDGIKYGYRSESFTNIDELYTNSRTEAFGELLKTAILFGSETLSTENYSKVYDKALRVRRVLAEAFAALFAEYDAVLLPVCSKSAYTEADVAGDKFLCFTENLYTAPASITGLPSVVVGGVSLIGKAFSEQTLLAIAELYEEVEA